MITKTAKLNNEKFDAFLSCVDQLREDGLITRKNQSIFKDKLRHLFHVRGNEADHFPNHYGLDEISFHQTFNIFERFDTMGGCVTTHRDPKPIPNLHLVFVGHEDKDEHKLMVSLSANYISELPVRYFINDTCVSVIDVKNLRTVRVLIKRLCGQKLYND